MSEAGLKKRQLETIADLQAEVERLGLYNAPKPPPPSAQARAEEQAMEAIAQAEKMPTERVREILQSDGMKNRDYGSCDGCNQNIVHAYRMFLAGYAAAQADLRVAFVKLREDLKLNKENGMETIIANEKAELLARVVKEYEEIQESGKTIEDFGVSRQVVALLTIIAEMKVQIAALSEATLRLDDRTSFFGGGGVVG